jgi:ATP-dependent RNA helicase DDX49/DBP8
VPHVVKLPFLVVALRHFGTDSRSVIVFTNSCVRCELVRMTLQLLGFPVCSLNSLLSQRQRLENLALFKTGISKILVATDVAARGLDIPQAGLVLHYDFPKLTATYVHRTGRTGRAGAEGESLAVCCTESEGYFLQRLENRLGSKVHGTGGRYSNRKQQRGGGGVITGSYRNMTVAEHEELLTILDEVSMAKVTAKTHLLDEFGDRISQHKEAASLPQYRANKSSKIRHDGRQNFNQQQYERRPQQQRQGRRPDAEGENAATAVTAGQRQPSRAAAVAARKRSATPVGRQVENEHRAVSGDDQQQEERAAIRRKRE